MESFKEKIKSLLSSKKFMIVISFLGLYLLSSGTSWAIFSYLRGEPTLESGSNLGLRFDPNLPKTEECPINGAMFTEPERAIWEQRRPIAAIIENHAVARPLSGISKADVVYEAVAEGGITRLLGIFYCGASAEDFRVAVIRSARIYFIDWAAEYGDNPIFLHWGGANNFCPDCPGRVKAWGQVAPEVDAYALLDKLGWRNGSQGNNLDGGYNIGVPVVKKLRNRLGPEDAQEEHQPVAFLDAAFEEAASRGFAYEDEDGNPWDENFIRWKFEDDKALSSPKTESISFEFWSNKADYDVEWKYDSSSNSYLRFNGGKPFTDIEFENRQVSVKNVVIQFVKERGPVDKELHMFYTTVGKGSALIFQNGDVVEGSWEKTSQLARIRFYDDKGTEISFVRGRIWIEAVPAGNEINY